MRLDEHPCVEGNANRHKYRSGLKGCQRCHSLNEVYTCSVPVGGTLWIAKSALLFLLEFQSCSQITSDFFSFPSLGCAFMVCFVSAETLKGLPGAGPVPTFDQVGFPAVTCQLQTFTAGVATPQRFQMIRMISRAPCTLHITPALRKTKACFLFQLHMRQTR